MKVLIMLKRYWFIYVLLLVSLVYFVGACIYGDDERITRSIYFFLSMIIVFVASIIRDRTIVEKGIKLSSIVIIRMLVLFVCSIAAILICYFTDYLIIGCAVAFILGCIALFDALRAVKSSERT